MVTMNNNPKIDAITMYGSMKSIDRICSCKEAKSPLSRLAFILS